MAEHEAILEALRDLLATDPDTFPPALIDEPDPSAWREIADTSPRLRDACAIQPGSPSDHLAFVRGGDDLDADELEMEPTVAYAVSALPDAGQTAADCRAARRARRDLAIRRLAALIAADRTLGLGGEVYAEVRPAQREDEVAFPNAEPGAVAMVPVRILYTAASAAD